MVVVQRHSCPAFKRVVYYCSYATSPSFGARYDCLDKASNYPYCFPSWYVITKSNQDNDIFQWAWQWFKIWVVIKYSRFLWSVYTVTWCEVPSSKWCHSWKESTIAIDNSHTCLNLGVTCLRLACYPFNILSKMTMIKLQVFMEWTINWFKFIQFKGRMTIQS